MGAKTNKRPDVHTTNVSFSCVDMDELKRLSKKFGRFSTVSQWASVSALEDIDRWKGMEREEDIGRTWLKKPTLNPNDDE